VAEEVVPTMASPPQEQLLSPVENRSCQQQTPRGRAPNNNNKPLVPEQVAVGMKP